MKPTWILAAGAAAVIAGSPVLADGGRGHHGGRSGGHHRGMMGLTLLQAADADGDKNVTRAEVTELQGEMFDWLDRNGDGVLDESDRSPIEQRLAARRAANADSADEAPEGPFDDGPGFRGRGGPHGGRLARLDADDNGSVSRDEFLAQDTRLFTSLDANADGTVTPDEIDAKMQEREHRREWWRED